MTRPTGRAATDESTCTPDFVPGAHRCRWRRRRSSISAYRCRQAPAAYPQASGGQPSIACAGRHLSMMALSWPCSGWGLPSHPGHPGCWWALTPPFHPYRTGHLAPFDTKRRSGGLFSVALSRGSPRVAVSNHPALWSPDVPRRRALGPPTRPPGRLVRRVVNGSDDLGERATTPAQRPGAGARRPELTPTPPGRGAVDRGRGRQRWRPRANSCRSPAAGRQARTCPR